jgi:V8-like Glu-specific endopeptidase
MSNILISSIREGLEERVAVGADVSDTIDFISEMLKANIKQKYFSKVIGIIGNYKFKENRFEEGLMTKEEFAIANAVLIKNLQSKLDQFEKFDRLGILRESKGQVVVLPDTVKLNNEKVIGQKNFHKIEWLLDGYFVSKNICKVRLDNSTGTGIYLKGGYLLTNRHVIPNLEAAKEAELIFNYTMENRDETILRTLDLDFDHVIGAKSDDLEQSFDFAIFKIKGNLEFEGIELNPDVSMPKVGTSVCVIQHPQGRPKELSLDLVHGVDDQMIQYKADTKGGSSGSPVFDKRWRLVGLHFGSLSNEDFNRGLRIDKLFNHLPSSWKDRFNSN